MWISAPIFGFLFVAAMPVIILMLGNQWREAAPVFQILTISALTQLLLESTIWLFVSRGQSQRLLKLLLFISPIIIGSYAIGLPFGIKGVAFSGSLVLLVILPWILKFAFRDTSLTLRGLGRALALPIALSLGGVLVAKFALHSINPQRVIPQLLVVAMGFIVAYSLAALIPPVRAEMMSFKNLLNEFRGSNRTAETVA